MTHAVAWIAAETAYVIADALVTSSIGTIDHAETTFGEKLDARNTIRNESAVKVVRLGDTAVATLSANDAVAGLAALETLKIHIGSGTCIEDALLQVQRLHP